MNDEAIDTAILAMLSEMSGYRKVAAVVSRVARSLPNDLSDDDAGYEAVAKRIEVLVDEGRLIAQGDLKKWRFSEVRLPD